jgi:hypothetical protein
MWKSYDQKRENRMKTIEQIKLRIAFLEGCKVYIPKPVVPPGAHVDWIKLQKEIEVLNGVLGNDASQMSEAELEEYLQTNGDE